MAFEADVYGRDAGGDEVMFAFCDDALVHIFLAPQVARVNLASQRPACEREVIGVRAATAEDWACDACIAAFECWKKGAPLKCQ
jgi:hypothetical protein